MAQFLDVSIETYVEQIEKKRLIKAGVVERTPRGRILSEKGIKYFNEKLSDNGRKLCYNRKVNRGKKSTERMFGSYVDKSDCSVCKLYKENKCKGV